MPHITICSDHKGQTLTTGLGQFTFDQNGECRLDPDLARKVLSKYPTSVFWSKKKGRPEVENDVVAAPAVQQPIKDSNSDNFGFPENVHVSRAARKALASGQLAPEEVITQHQKAMTALPPTTTLTDDLVKAKAAVIPGKSEPSLSEDVSDEAPRKQKTSSKTAKASGKRRK